MACFIAPTSVAIITTALRKKLPKQWHINWLNTMIWGGAVALAVEHIAHQEIVPWLPFLTAMSNPADTVVMLKEIAIVGIPMTLGLIFAWVVMVVVYENFIATNRLSATARNTVK
ncbi:MAG: hypothetical protein ABIB43_03980 [archaeon]